jgi:transcriptional regulator with XRE-family HTH domain
MEKAEKKNSIRDIIGFTQEELAMLLGITRSKLAKFELGEGVLPDEANHLLSELLNHMENSEKNHPLLANDKTQPIVNNKQLDKLIKENEYQLEKTSRKINTIQRKQSAKFKALLLLDYLYNLPEAMSEEQLNVVKFISSYTDKSLKINSQLLLYKLQIKQQMLTYAQTLLESEKEKWLRIQ